MKVRAIGAVAVCLPLVALTLPTAAFPVTTVSDTGLPVADPAMSGGCVAWSGQVPGLPDWLIFLYDGTTVTQLPYDPSNVAHMNRHPAVANGRVVWDCDEHPQLFMYNYVPLETKWVISGGTVVWDAQGHGIWAYNTTTGATQQLSPTGSSPAVSGANVVWSDGGIQFCDLTTGWRTSLSSAGFAPAISSSDVVWVEGTAIRMTTMPEPATLCLVALGGLAILRRRGTGR